MWNVNTNVKTELETWKQVLIETLWNVNEGGTVAISSVGCMVLIETLWNVNKKITESKCFPLMVLIETLWNVNYRESCRGFSRIRINRNIVECKCTHFRLPLPVMFGINRNIVECKYNADNTAVDMYKSINRNIVECKY